MNIGITGVTGFIGREIAKQALGRGWRVIGFSRNPNQKIDFAAETRLLNNSTPPDLSDTDAIIHLSGESIAGFWTEQKKRRIRSSRILGTMAVAEAIRTMKNPPKTFVSCSAVGFYGDNGESVCDESSPCGQSFLADVAREWEATALEACFKKKPRIVLMRLGMVLGSTGGAMRLIKPVFKAGLGGNLGSGQQWMSLIHVEDVAGMFLTAVENKKWSGPINAVLPVPVRNSDFTRAVAHCAKRPAFLNIPAAVLRLTLGDASALALDSLRVIPSRAMELDYNFYYPTLESSVAACFPS